MKAKSLAATRLYTLNKTLSHSKGGVRDFQAISFWGPEKVYFPKPKRSQSLRTTTIASSFPLQYRQMAID
ncbi:MAG: hypothetical protein HN763_13975 [Opitutales bacterium]|nr:hypothetical protein [Opitutales bacterium]